MNLWAVFDWSKSSSTFQGFFNFLIPHMRSTLNQNTHCCHPTKIPLINIHYRNHEEKINCLHKMLLSMQDFCWFYSWWQICWLNWNRYVILANKLGQNYFGNRYKILLKVDLLTVFLSGLCKVHKNKITSSHVESTLIFYTLWLVGMFNLSIIFRSSFQSSIGYIGQIKRVPWIPSMKIELWHTSTCL